MKTSFLLRTTLFGYETPGINVFKYLYLDKFGPEEGVTSQTLLHKFYSLFFYMNTFSLTTYTDYRQITMVTITLTSVPHNWTLKQHFTIQGQVILQLLGYTARV